MASRIEVADGAGALGAIFAALCCAGTPVVLGALSVVGLSFLRRDAILWPLMLGSLMIALWGFSRGVQSHRKRGPMVVAIIGAVSLACGVIVVHGPSAMTMIYAGAISLVFATVWNVVERRRATLPLIHGLRTADRG